MTPGRREVVLFERKMEEKPLATMRKEWYHG